MTGLINDFADMARNVTAPTLRVIADTELRRLSAAAAELPRRRKNLNLHPLLDDPIQRLFHAMEPGTFVRPHRHARPDGWELMLAARGAFSILTFDRTGLVLARADLVAGTGDAAAEIPAYVWHAVVVMVPGTIMFEVKPGPYHVLTDKDFADWAPLEGAPAASDFVAWYERARPGDGPPQGC